MGHAFEHAVQTDAACMMQTYARKPALFVRGEGMRLYDDDGREYLDFVSGIGAVNLGHAHPAVTQAVAGQMASLVHVSNLFHVEHRADLACELARLLGGEWRTFFCNSGAEASEGAIKLARKWAREHKPGATRIVTLERSFHGRTLAALAATGQASKQEAFSPLPAGFVHVPINDVEALDRALDETACALFIEVVQGEGGVWPASAEYLAAAQQLCADRHCLFMVDEVQTGFFRTGPAFAHQEFGLAPHVVTLAKAMANGLPIGAVVARPDVAAAFAPGDHGSTFGGGPVVCAAALATISALETEKLGGTAKVSGAHLVGTLNALAESTDAITEVRGSGLMVGASLRSPKAPDVAAWCLRHGVVVNHIGDSILRFLPPLVAGREEIGTLGVVLSDAFSEVEV